MLRPIDARIVIQKPQRQEQTESGIFLPDTVSEQAQTALGEVIAVGPGSRSLSGELMPMQIEVGDNVIYMKFGGTEVQHNGEDLMVLAEKDIIAVVED